MVVNSRALFMIFLVAGISFAADILRAPPARADLTCFAGFRDIGEDPMPSPLMWKRRRNLDSYGNPTATIEKSKVKDLARLKVAARVVDTNDVRSARALSNLEDGIYVWGLDAHGRMAVLPRNMNPKAGEAITANSEFMGSHSGLIRVLRSQKRDAEFVATGEFLRRNGRVFSVDNSSGTYPGGTENLRYGIGRLKRIGLEIDEGTRIIDASIAQKQGAHDAAYRQIPIEFKVSADPQLKSIYEETRRVMRVADRRFDDSLVFVAIPDTLPTSDRLGMSNLYERWQNPSEGTAYSFYEVLQNRFGGNVERYKAALREFERAAEKKPQP